MLLQTKFSNNWNNKLDCNCFTTVRIDSNKYKLNDVHAIIENGVLKKKAIIRSIKRMYLHEITNEIAYLDVGKDAEYLKNLLNIMYKNKGVNFSMQKLVVIYFQTC